MNQVFISGRLTRDCTPFYTDNGLCVNRFAVAAPRPIRKTGDGNQKLECDFIQCVAFGAQGERIANTLHKGNRIFVLGRLEVGSYMNKENKKVITHNIIVNSFEYAEPKTTGEPPTEAGNFSDFGVEEIEF